jgi:hypothetical protein
MTSTFWRFKLQLLLAMAAVLGGTATFVGASVATGTAPAVSAATLTACSSVALTATSAGGSPAPVALVASADCDGPTVYAFFDRSLPTSPWTLIRGWGGQTLKTSAAAGAQFLVWATDGAHTVPQVQAEQGATLASDQEAPCTSASISSNLEVANPGQPVGLTATARCPAGADVEYSYFERSTASTTWKLQAAWTGASWSWTAPSTQGVYQVLVWATDGPYTVPQTQSSTDVYDGVPATCTTVSAQVASAAAGTAGGPITLAASSTCPQGSSPEYSYFVGPSTTGPWTLRAAWIGPSWTSSPSVAQFAPQYAIVWVSDGPYTIPQAQAKVTLISAPVGCSAVTPSTAPSESALVGTTVGVSASSTCSSSSAAEYSYFTGGSTSGPWTLQAAWTGANWSWRTSDEAPGTYYVLVWASDGPYTVPQAQSAVAITLTSAAITPVTTGPLANPSSNLLDTFNASCWPAGYRSLSCGEAEVTDIDSALAGEGVQPLIWSPALYNLSISEQAFVVTNEERVLRGLAPIVGMDTAADQNALLGAQAEEDPQTGSVPGEIAAVGNWAEDYGPLASDFDWMYNDGPGSFNVDCPPGSNPSSSGCWVHRDQILTNTASGAFAAPGGYTWAAGAACISGSSLSYDSICDLEYVLIPSASVSFDFTWAQAVALGA